MYSINVTNLKKIIKINTPITVYNLIKKYLPKLSKIFVAVIINNEIQDKNYLITRSLEINILLINDNKSLYIIRQCNAFLCAYAIKKLWPYKQEYRISITENGFLYDFDMPYRISSKDLSKIENKMLYLLKHKSSKISIGLFNKIDIKKILKRYSEFYLEENINIYIKNRYLNKIFFIDNYVSFYPFLVTENIHHYSHFKLKDVSGVYKNKKDKMIQRIRGVVFNSKKKLQDYVFLFNKIKEVDHRKISKKIDIYHIEKDNPGLVFWHDNGLIIFNILKKFIQKKIQNFKYKEVQTPLILNEDYWKKTGHLTYYKDYIYTINNNNKKLCVKPMNCPGHVQIYKQNIISYKDLPIKMSEFGNCFRNESSGSLHGLMRLKSFTQDDGHIFCSLDQLNNEINEYINLVYDVYEILGFKKILLKLSTRPINRYGSELEWDKYELKLAHILINKNINFTYQLNCGAFYGPKIEFILTDSLNREWQCGTLQIDFSLAQRLNIFFIDKNNHRKHPIIIHRAILGSLERFIGIILEEYKGNLPIWLSPIQVIVINISDKQEEYAGHINNLLLQSKIRSILDIRSQKLSYKIRENIIKNIPYIIICGEKERKYKLISFRNRNINTVKLIPIKHFICYLLSEIHIN